MPKAAVKKSAPKKASAPKVKKVVKVVEADTGEDLYIVIGREKHQFSSKVNPFYAVKEYYWMGSFTNGLDIKFVHADGKEVPTHQDRNCGYTLIGKAKSYIKANKALTTPGEPSDDQEYVYINEHSTLTYVGETGDHTLYVRVYDNLSGTNNDRWAVVYLD